MRGVVATLLMLVAVLGLSDLVFAENNGVWGRWFYESPCSSGLFSIRFSESGLFCFVCDDQDFIEEKGVGQDRIFTPGEDTLKTIIERGAFTVSENSIIIHITESDIADRIGITFTVTFSISGDSITFTNARELTFGYVDEERVTLYDREYEAPEPFVGWWEIYPPEQRAEFSALFGIQLDRWGSFYSFCQDGVTIEERGTYIVSGDSVTITITESGFPDRVGLRFTVTFWLFPDWGGITFTNAPILTAGYIKEETIILGRAFTVVRSATWGRVKASHR